MSAGIYVVVNTLNQWRYIGSTARLSMRLKQHRAELTRQVHKNTHFQNAWNKYGPDAFIFDVLEVVADPAHLLTREQYWIDQFKPRLYNIDKVAARPDLGVARKPRTPEHRRNLGAARRGVPHPYTDEQRRKILASNKRRTGEKHTAETIQKMRAAKKGWAPPPITEATREKFKELGRCRTYSPETRAKMSASAKRRGDCTPPEKRGTGMRGKHRTPEHNEHMREALKAAWLRRTLATIAW